MRLWSIHPTYLDTKGLVALWREGLLAQKVLQGKTIGYKNHPQLIRFKNTINPIKAIATYLTTILQEANNRGFNFNKNKILENKYKKQIPVTNKQIIYEFEHLLKKLETRDLNRKKTLLKTKTIKIHPLFKKINGDIEQWEKI